MPKFICDMRLIFMYKYFFCFYLARCLLFHPSSSLNWANSRPNLCSFVIWLCFWRRPYSPDVKCFRSQSFCYSYQTLICLEFSKSNNHKKGTKKANIVFACWLEMWRTIYSLNCDVVCTIVKYKYIAWSRESDIHHVAP